MYQTPGPSKQTCRLIAVLCGKFADRRKEVKCWHSYPFPQLISSGRLEVHTLVNPALDSFCNAQHSLEPNILYLQGEQLENEEEIGALIWGDLDVSEPDKLCSLIAPPLPTIVYLEVPNGEKTAQALHSKGIPYVIYWKNSFSSYAASHFCQALLSVVQSSCSHVWDAFQLARASFHMYCARNNYVLPVNGQKVGENFGPCLLGNAPKINIIASDRAPEEGEQISSGTLPATHILDDDMVARLLVCGMPCALDANILGSLEDGLNALLNIEIRGSKLHNRISAAPPPLQAGSISHGVVTMRCDLSTCSSAHISLFVSGSAQTCFNDQLLESHIKSELIEENKIIQSLPDCDPNMSSLSEPLHSVSIACGASAFEVRVKLPSWAAQVLKQLAPEVSYRSLVTLGIASIQGVPVASFEKEDADRLLFFWSERGMECFFQYQLSSPLLASSTSLVRKRSNPFLDANKPIADGHIFRANGSIFAEEDQGTNNAVSSCERIRIPSTAGWKRFKIATMRPIPSSRKRTKLSSNSQGVATESNRPKTSLSTVPCAKHYTIRAPLTHRKSMPGSFHAQQAASVNPLPVKKHGCDRRPIQVCTEEEFLEDVMQFLVIRGHSRLVSQGGGVSEFPEAVLNTIRLDLFNLYKEVVSRGGFYVGNGINWKGQVFPKMQNYTVSNRMTGVGNTLKRHYETYLLEYELAHDDVDGECCLLCHSTPGDWVNCGLCGEWAHFGCDTRQGLATFKEYAKTDGLEYICPNCSLTSSKKKSQKAAMDSQSPQ